MYSVVTVATKLHGPDSSYILSFVIIEIMTNNKKNDWNYEIALRMNAELLNCVNIYSYL